MKAGWKNLQRLTRRQVDGAVDHIVESIIRTHLVKRRLGPYSATFVPSSFRSAQCPDLAPLSSQAGDGVDADLDAKGNLRR